MMSCRDIARTIATDELENATLWRRLGVRFHLLMCRHCRRYAAQIRAIGRAARELSGRSSPSEAAERQLRAKIVARLCDDGEPEP